MINLLAQVLALFSDCTVTQIGANIPIFDIPTRITNDRGTNGGPCELPSNCAPFFHKPPAVLSSVNLINSVNGSNRSNKRQGNRKSFYS